VGFNCPDALLDDYDGGHELVRQALMPANRLGNQLAKGYNL
jgi:hypothetical protein